MENNFIVQQYQPPTPYPDSSDQYNAPVKNTNNIVLEDYPVKNQCDPVMPTKHYDFSDY